LKFKIDENLPAEYALILRESGFDADTVGEENLSGSEDAVIFQHCCSESLVLITLDLDFANVRAYPPRSHSGIVVLRCKSQDKPTLIGALRRVLPTLMKQSPEKQLWVVEHDRIRYREE
jgi:predicted nuclease of predicted toxin-antitoxin system